MSKIVQFRIIQFSISSLFSSIWPADKTLLGATTPSQNGSWSNGNKGVFCIPQSSCITGTSPSDCLVSYPGYSLDKFYLFTMKLLVYSAAPADWAKGRAGNVVSTIFRVLENWCLEYNFHSFSFHAFRSLWLFAWEFLVLKTISVRFLLYCFFFFLFFFPGFRGAQILGSCTIGAD